MRILITYSSRTGNTRKVAEALYEEFKDCADLKSVETVGETDGYDYIFIGYWADKGGPDALAKAFMARLSGQKTAIFATLGAYPYSIHAHRILVNGAQCLSEKNKVLGAFICQGPVDPALLARFRSLPKDDPHAPGPTAELRHKLAKSHPDAADLASARRIFRQIVERDLG